MLTSSILLNFLGCFAFYSTAKSTSLLQTIQLEKWIETHILFARFIGVVLLILGFITSVYVFGATAGLLHWVFLVAMIMSLLIVLYPLKKIRIQPLVFFFLTLFLIEFIICSY